jgi:hypothetical protein
VRIKINNRLELSREDIQTDITAFDQRIEKARQQLLSLPATAPDWKARKKLKAMRIRLSAEIEHVQRIRGYAIDSLGGQMGCPASARGRQRFYGGATNENIFK